MAEKYAEALGVRVVWLERGEGPMREMDEAELDMPDEQSERRMADPNRYAELLRRIDGRLEEMGNLKDREICRRAGLKEHALQTIRRGNKPGADVLPKLARAMDLPETYLTEAILPPSPDLEGARHIIDIAPIQTKSRAASPLTSATEIDNLPPGTMPKEFGRLLNGIAEFLSAGPNSYEMAIEGVLHLAERIRESLPKPPELEEAEDSKSRPTSASKR